MTLDSIRNSCDVYYQWLHPPEIQRCDIDQRYEKCSSVYGATSKEAVSRQKSFVIPSGSKEVDDSDDKLLFAEILPSFSNFYQVAVNQVPEFLHLTFEFNFNIQHLII